MVSITAPGSLDTGAAGRSTSRRRNSRATKTANTMPKTAMNPRVRRCQRVIQRLPSHIPSRPRALQIGERQLHVGLSIVLILFERECDVERGLVLGEVV